MLAAAHVKSCALPGKLLCLGSSLLLNGGHVRQHPGGSPRSGAAHNHRCGCGQEGDSCGAARHDANLLGSEGRGMTICSIGTVSPLCCNV